MTEINFLSDNNKDSGGKAKNKKNKNNIKWSEPDEDDKIESGESSNKLFRWFSFYKKNKAANQDKGSLIIEKQKKNESEQTIMGGKADFNKPVKNAQAKKSVKKKIKQKQEEQEWGNPDILETNLIKSEIVSFFDWRKGVISLIIACLLPCFIIGGIYGFLFSWEKKMNYKNQDILNKINETNRQIKELEVSVKDVLFFQKKLKVADQLLDSHIYWTNFFNFLENHTLSNVFYSGFSGDTSGNYSFETKAKDFWTIAQQVKTMRASNNVLSVKVGEGQSAAGSGAEEQGVNFKLDLSVDPEIFTE